MASEYELPRRTPTVWERLRAIRDPKADRREAVHSIVQKYWRPVYAAMRISWKLPAAEARQVACGFFHSLLEGSQRVDPDAPTAGFRSMMKTAIRAYMSAGTPKAVADAPEAPIDPFEPDPSPDEIPEDTFDREWARVVVMDATERVLHSTWATRQEMYWGIFEAHDLADGEPAGLDTLGAKYGISRESAEQVLRGMHFRIREAAISRIAEYARTEAEAWKELEELTAFWRGTAA